MSGNEDERYGHMSSDAVTMESDSRIKAYKFVAYSAVSFSIIAVLSVVISLPMVYNYVAHVRRQMHREINYCKVISRS
ncbi:hypothetical protein WUBG_09909 [Wuchereria bancrofti]|uniref:Nematode cuticle collagen N-terminal domain-containing protein n=1 Tax=Wuchereria bancrofti TaxID=6293 RepID=J9EA10_WUCBA|nr:hypothetical protein WUBG_09909 [Wuchereria bancrofti]